MLLYSEIDVIMTVMESQLWWNVDFVVWLYRWLQCNVVVITTVMAVLFGTLKPVI